MFIRIKTVFRFSAFRRNDAADAKRLKTQPLGGCVRGLGILPNKQFRGLWAHETLLANLFRA